MSEHDTPPRVYLSGLDLAGRRVLVVGAGRVATRRIPRLLEAGAAVDVIAPVASKEIAAHAAAGRLTWTPRAARPADVQGAWYVMAASDDQAANDLVGRAAAEQRIFCVRCDDVHRGSAWTPSVAAIGQHLVAVLGNRDPRGTTGLLARIQRLLLEPPAGTDEPCERIIAPQPDGRSATKD